VFRKLVSPLATTTYFAFYLVFSGVYLISNGIIRGMHPTGLIYLVLGAGLVGAGWQVWRWRVNFTDWACRMRELGVESAAREKTLTEWEGSVARLWTAWESYGVALMLGVYLLVAWGLVHLTNNALLVGGTVVYVCAEFLVPFALAGGVALYTRHKQ
jgi:hypothetical protein